MECALKRNAQKITMYPKGKEKKDVVFFLMGKRKQVIKILKNGIREHDAIKWYLTLQVQFIKTKTDGEEVTSEPYFNKCNFSLHLGEIKKQVRRAYADLLTKFGNYIRDGSGWHLQRCIKLIVNLVKYRPTRGSSYFQLPKHLQLKHAIINIHRSIQAWYVHIIRL